MIDTQPDEALAILLEELEDADIPEPRMSLKTVYKDVGVVVVHHDRFIGILEFDEDTKQQGYVALGKIIEEENTKVQVVDCRVVNDISVFEKAIRVFVEFLKDQEPKSTIVIEGQEDHEAMIKHMCDMWNHTQMMNEVIVH